MLARVKVQDSIVQKKKKKKKVLLKSKDKVEFRKKKK